MSDPLSLFISEEGDERAAVSTQGWLQPLLANLEDIEYLTDGDHPSDATLLQSEAVAVTGSLTVSF